MKSESAFELAFRLGVEYAIKLSEFRDKLCADLQEHATNWPVDAEYANRCECADLLIAEQVAEYGRKLKSELLSRWVIGEPSE